jgi:hypothetical protein
MTLARCMRQLATLGLCGLRARVAQRHAEALAEAQVLALDARVLASGRYVFVKCFGARE